MHSMIDFVHKLVVSIGHSVDGLSTQLRPSLVITASSNRELAVELRALISERDNK